MKPLSSPQLRVAARQGFICLSAIPRDCPQCTGVTLSSIRKELLVQSVDISPGESSGVTVGDYPWMLRGKTEAFTILPGLAFRLAGEAWVYCKGDSLTKGGTNHSHHLSHVKVTTPTRFSVRGFITEDNFPSCDRGRPRSSILQPQNNPLLGNFSRSRL